jgi:Ribosomal protein L17
MIGLGKRGTLHSRRQALRFVKSKEAMLKLFGELAERFRDRNGGYCRIIKLGKNRLGDNADMAIVQLLGSELDKLSDLKTQKSTKKKQKKKGTPVLREVRDEIQKVADSKEKKDQTDPEELIEEEKIPDDIRDDTSNIEKTADTQEVNLKDDSQVEPTKILKESDTKNIESETTTNTKDDSLNIDKKADAQEVNLKDDSQVEPTKILKESDTKNIESETTTNTKDDSLNIDKKADAQEVNLKDDSQVEETEELNENNKTKN